MSVRARARHPFWGCLPAPARLLVQSAGAVLLVCAFTSCGGDSEREDRGPRVLELDSVRMQLPDSVQLVVIALERSSPADLSPAQADVRVGDIVRFEARDAANHAIGFDGGTLAPEARAFLEASGQMRSPPLVSKGNAWVVSFAGAPAGTYAYSCVTHGARGVVVVSARP